MEKKERRKTMIQFHETKRGRIYYDSLVPRLVNALEKIASRMEKEEMEAANKVFVYKEYFDRDAYGEELVEVYADQKTAEERLKRRVEGHFKKKWEKIPELFTEDDILLPDHVTFCDGDAMAFWTVEEHEVLKETEYHMTADRAKELLNMVIDHVSAGNNCHETLKELLKIGFTGEELFSEFSFNLLDVADAEEDVAAEKKEEEK